MTLAQFAFLADENIHPGVIAHLRDQGLNLVTVEALGLHGAEDIAIIRSALAAKRVVLTHDSDFGSLAIAGREPIYGIVYLRPGHIQAEFTIQTLKTLFDSGLHLTPPFLLVGVRRDQVVRTRLRPLT